MSKLYKWWDDNSDRNKSLIFMTFVETENVYERIKYEFKQIGFSECLEINYKIRNNILKDDDLEKWCDANMTDEITYCFSHSSNKFYIFTTNVNDLILFKLSWC